MRKIEFEKEPRGFFLRAKCVGCGNSQVVFSCASKPVKCLACGQPIAEPGAGKISLKLKD